ncbi:MAG: ABC transporter ATP-binding protein [Myxococcales bacterium]|nr:ABC transporter ATP-binding protein [Polyangiaceae bacterium]MDW8248660.1 ABC transporter ATP-binding protein [Myxococcales bacterium]
MTALIEVEHLTKTFFLGITRKRVDAVKGVSFSVQSNEIFGFLGPNGSGKTTTIKMLTGLIRPTGGRATLFGHPVPSVEAMRRVGFLPESPYIFPYLTPREYVEMCGRLSGLRGQALRDRTTAVLRRTGIEYAGERPVRKLSKGMTQRSALAAALVANPELLVLDEPMSGLDPIGRKEVRDIILEERREGRTVFFSTHILADAESLCDRVTILREGRAVVSGPLRDLVRGDVLHTDLTLAQASEALEMKLRAAGHETHRRAGLLVVEIRGQERVNDTLLEAIRGGAQVVEVSPRRETLEDLFVRRAIDAPTDEPRTTAE